MLGVLGVLGTVEKVHAEPMYACVLVAADHEDKTGFAHQIPASAAGMLSSVPAAVLQNSAVVGQTSPVWFRYRKTISKQYILRLRITCIK